MVKINKPGQDSRNDSHYNPHSVSKGSSPHAGMGRSNAGTFNGPGGPHLAPGGNSSHGDETVNKHKPGSPAPKGGSGHATPTTGGTAGIFEGDDWL